MLWVALRQGTLEVAIGTTPKPGDLQDLVTEPLANGM